MNICFRSQRHSFIEVRLYITRKNRHNTPSRLELRKLCPYCCKHTIHGEIKK